MEDFFQTLAACITATCLMKLISGVVTGVIGKDNGVGIYRGLGIKIGNAVRDFYNS